MNDGKIIIDKIISDAQKIADATISQAEKEADLLLKSAKEKAQKQLDQIDREVQSEAERIKAKEISAAEMQAKKKLLETKQEILNDVMAEVEKRLSAMNDAEYAKVIAGMLSRVERIANSEIIVSPKDKQRLADTVKENGFCLSERTADISGGFILKNGDIEYNYSFASILSVEKEVIRKLAADILF